MKSKFLFPAWCAIVGYVMALPGFVLGYLGMFKNYEIPGFGFRMREKDSLFQSAFENFTNELALFLVVGGLILIAFSKQKREDELNAKLRLNSLYWGVMSYYLIYVFGLVYSIFGEIPFVGEHGSALNLFAPLLIFIVRFYYLKWVNKDQYLVKEPRFLPFFPFKVIGRLMAVIGLVVFTAAIIKDLSESWGDPISNASFLCLILGLMLWAFSKNKVEDEMVMQHRLESLQLAVYFNYALLLLSAILVYSLAFLFVMVIAQFSLLLFFIIRMEYVNYKDNKLLITSAGGLSHEK
jgi:FtsH-binding integral membrane protein